MDFNFIGLDEIWAEVFSHRKLERECRRYRLWDFPGDPVFRVLPVLGTWAQSLVQELRSHTPAKKKKKKKPGTSHLRIIQEPSFGRLEITFS